MITLKGKSVCEGIAIGRVLFMHNKVGNSIEKKTVTAIEEEIKRFEKARQRAKEELVAIYQLARREVGEEEAQIFEIHQMMLDDDDLVEGICLKIREEKVCAEYAVYEAVQVFIDIFSSMDDAYMRGRASDLSDIRTRLIKVLSGEEKEKLLEGDEPIILAAYDLTPSETMEIERSKLAGFITIGGSTYSHTAILAKTINIPSVVAIGERLKSDIDGKVVIIDGFKGNIYVEPDGALREHYQRMQLEIKKQSEALKVLKGKETKTLDGRKVDLYANIGDLSDLKDVIENDAEGIGVFRSEFIYLQRDDYPTEEEQFAIYKEVAEVMAGKRVVIRTLDIGADKKASYFNLPEEENTAMGYRAIRICLMEPTIFITQLRAILRASAYGKLAIMIPMIISVEEVRQAKQYVEQVKEALRREKIPFDEMIELGIMIETPAAVMISDLLAPEVDFFSLGTNDLTQYTLAIDRQNQKLETFYNPYHPAILRMIKITIDAAHKHNKWVGICGELGADESLTKVFLEMGIDELSVTPPSILPMRKWISEMVLGDRG